MNQMSKKKHIGLDFDDVLMVCCDNLLLYHNNIYGTNHAKHEAVSFDLSKLWNITKEESYERIANFYSSKEHSAMTPKEGVIEALTHLATTYDLSIITARPQEAREVTHELLKKLPNVFKAIHFVGVKHGHTSTTHTTKRDVCIAEGIDLFIEDNSDNALAVAGAGIPCFLLNEPWNESYELPNNITRVYSWSEILEKIDKKLLV